MRRSLPSLPVEFADCPRCTLGLYEEDAKPQALHCKERKPLYESAEPRIVGKSEPILSLGVIHSLE
jgi:hypothetical protein